MQIQVMNLSLINQSLAAQAQALEQVKRFSTVLDAIEATCTKNNFKGYEDFLTQLAAFEASVAAPVEGKTQEKEPKVGAKRKKNKKMTPAIKQAIIDDLTAGKKVAKVAKSHGFSTATVNLIKKDANLVKPRKPKEAQPAPPAASNVADLVPSGSAG